MTIRPLGVIVGGGDPVASLRAVEDLGLECCQMTVPASEWLTGEQLENVREAAARIPIVGCFCHYSGESYADIPTIRRTIGLVNPETRAERVKQTLRYSDLITALKVPTLLAHIGFIPDDRQSPNYRQIVDAMREICRRCAANGQQFGLETGQETAPALSQFIEDVGEPNLKVNFDPANMLMYGSGKPLEALTLLRQHLVSVHCKDGHWPASAGVLGEEAPLGQGEVNIPAFIGLLRDFEFTGPLIIEREISGEQQRNDILKARDWLRELR